MICARRALAFDAAADPFCTLRFSLSWVSCLLLWCLGRRSPSGSARYHNSALIRGLGFMPFALRRFSESSWFHSRCFSAQAGQRVCPWIVAWPQRHRPCSLRSCRVRAGVFGAWTDFFGLVRVDFRREAGFVRLLSCFRLCRRVRLGINMVSVKSRVFGGFTPVHVAPSAPVSRCPQIS